MSKYHTHATYCLPFRKGRLAINPVGFHILNPFRSGGVLEVTGVEYREFPGGYWLSTKFFNGEIGPDVNAGIARILQRR
jgi:hypothetical protein